MKYYVYILQSLKDHKFYIGCTSNLEKRLQYHNDGKNRSTKYRRPLKIIYSEEFKNKQEAFRREFYLKSPKGFLEKKELTKQFLSSAVAQW